jgi:hypothetical protein
MSFLGPAPRAGCREPSPVGLGPGGLPFPAPRAPLALAANLKQAKFLPHTITRPVQRFVTIAGSESPLLSRSE